MLPERLARDPRLLPVRNGVAAEHLKGVVEASRFVFGQKKQVKAGASALRKAPEARAEQIDQALFGEGVSVYLEEGGWAFVQYEVDHYVGWMRADELGAPVEPTHRVKAMRTFIYEKADMKSAPLVAVSMNARLALGEVKGEYARVHDLGWVFAQHVGLLGDFEADWVGVAERFVGSPYLWGGRESAGIDCSGLVQVSMQATGKAPLRDSDMQELTIGEALDISKGLPELKRGDLVFWNGHVAIVANDGHVLHASERDMQVGFEPIDKAFARVRGRLGEIRTVRRVRPD